MDDFEADQSHVMGLLSPILGRVTPLFEEALDLHNSEVSPRARAELGVRAITSAVSDHAWAAFSRAFDEEDGFHFLEKNGLKVLNIRDEVLVRLKKVDENGRHKNADTAQQRAFDSQKDLPGLPPAAVRVVLGYQPDEAFSEVVRVTVRRPKGRWVAQIVDGDVAPGWVDITPVELPFGETRKARRA